MQKYELTLVLPEKATPAKKKSVRELIKKLIDTNEGKVVKEDEWGKIDLSYEINGESAGVFLHDTLELKPESVKQINEKLRLEQDILRYLLVKMEG